MKPEISPLVCPESFEKMKPGGFGRHCESCQTSVVDLTSKSWDEIYAMRLQHGDHFCGGYTEAQFHDIAQNRRPISFDLKKGFLLTSVFLAMGAQQRGVDASPKFDLVDYCKHENLTITTVNTVLSGRVTNHEGKPLPEAKVYIEGMPETSTFSNEYGIFQLESDLFSKDLIGKTLLVQKIGYNLYDIELTEFNLRNAEISAKLQKTNMLMEAIVLVPYEPKSFDRITIEKDVVVLDGVVAQEQTATPTEVADTVQNFILRGLVTDSEGTPLPLVTVKLLEYREVFTQCDMNGEFILETGLTRDELQGSTIVAGAYVGYFDTPTLLTEEALAQDFMKLTLRSASLPIDAIVEIKPDKYKEVICGLMIARPIRVEEIIMPEPTKEHDEFNPAPLSDFTAFKKQQQSSFKNRTH